MFGRYDHIVFLTAFKTISDQQLTLRVCRNLTTPRPSLSINHSIKFKRILICKDDIDFNIMGPRQNDHHFADDIWFNEKYLICFKLTEVCSEGSYFQQVSIGLDNGLAGTCDKQLYQLMPVLFTGNPCDQSQNIILTAVWPSQCQKHIVNWSEYYALNVKPTVDDLYRPFK